MSDLKTLLDKMFAVPVIPEVKAKPATVEPVDLALIGREPDGPDPFFVDGQFRARVSAAMLKEKGKKAKRVNPEHKLVAVPKTKTAVKLAAVPKAKATTVAKAPKKRKPKKTRIEELDAVCSHPTLNVPGWLILDYAMVDGVERVVHACFDPVQDEIDNVEITVSGLMRTEKRIALTDADDGTRWSFALVEDAESLVDADADDDDIEVDADAADYEVEDDHPFNQ